MKLFHHPLFRRTAAALGAIAALTVTGLATSQTVTLSGTGSNSCTYQEMTVTPNGNVQVVCSGGSSAGSFSLSGATSLDTGVANSGTKIKVTRTGGSTGSVDVNLSAGGACTLVTPTPMVFASGETTAKNFEVSTDPNAGTCAIAISPQAPGTNGSPISRNVSIVNPEANVSFAFATGTSSTSVAGSTVPIVINRTGGSANEWLVQYVASGAMTSNEVVTVGSLVPASPSTAGTLKFPAGSSTATLNYTPPATPPASPSLPASLVLQLGAVVTTATTTQQGTVGLLSQHTLSLNSQAVGCGTEISAVALGSEGTPQFLGMANGGVKSYILPTPPAGYQAGIFKLSETTSSNPKTPWSYEIHINKCKGLIAPSTTDTCYSKSGNKTLHTRTFITSLPSGKYTTEAGVKAAGLCYAPTSQGPWYVNVKYNLEGGCSTSQCGWYAQWTRFATNW